MAWSAVALAADDLATLINQRNYQAAYDLAKQLQDKRAGEPDFDFYYGLAALESGHPQEAVFALERVIAMVPEDHRARLELARAHFMLGNFEQSKKLFQKVLESEPPPKVQENIRYFLDQIEQGAQQRDRQLSASVALKLGYDSNVNSATDDKRVTLPIGLTLQLGDSSREIGDDFYNITVDGSYLQLMRKDMGYFLSAGVDQRSNVQYSQFDIRTTNVGGGYIYKPGRYSIRVPLQYQYLQVDEAKFRATPSVGLEWSFVPDPNGQFVLFSQLARQFHAEAQNYRDVDSRLLGFGYSRAMVPTNFRWSLSVYHGVEESLRHGNEEFGRGYRGGRLAGTWTVEGGHEFQVSYAKQQVKHDATNTSFQKIREDDFDQLGLDWGWSYNRHLRFGLVLDFISNSSNISIYSYNRAQQYFTTRYRF